MEKESLKSFRSIEESQKKAGPHLFFLVSVVSCLTAALVGMVCYATFLKSYGQFELNPLKLQLIGLSATWQNPVILVPGFGGSQMKVKLDKSDGKPPWCEHRTLWNTLWLNMEKLAPKVVECTAENMRMIYDPTSNSSTTVPGVSIRIPGFGNTSSLEVVDSRWNSGLSTTSFQSISNALEEWGYKRNINLRGAPYDFRKGPNEMEDFMVKLAKLIEDTYSSNRGKPVHIVGHSLGNLHVLKMLQDKSQEWKDKYVKSWISLSAPFGGSIEALRYIISGGNFGMLSMNPLDMQKALKTMPSLIWMLPYSGFWDEFDTILQLENQTYSIDDYAYIFQKIDYAEGWEIRQNIEQVLKDFSPPGVHVHCIHGIGRDTALRLYYGKGSLNQSRLESQPLKKLFSDGDGAASLTSLSACKNWIGQQTHPVHHVQLPKAEHGNILLDDRIVNYLKDIMFSP